MDCAIPPLDTPTRTEPDSKTRKHGRVLRIGVVGPISPDSFADNILSGLGQMGHVAVPLGAAAPAAGRALTTIYRTTTSAAPALLEAWQRRIVKKARAAELDAILSVDGRLDPSTVRLLRDTAAIALWYPDAVANLGAQVMLACRYDHIFFKDPTLVRRLTGLTDLPVHYLPEACNPAWHRPGPRFPTNPVILVAGNLYPSRVRLLEKLHRVGIPLELHSDRWARSLIGFDVQRLPILPEIHKGEKATAFRQSAAVLNNLHPGEEGMNCRLFEAAGCGAVVLCEDRPVLNDLFNKETDLLAFSDFDSLVEKARWALDNPILATEVGDSAARRAHADHTYQHRLNGLLDIMAVSR